MFNDDLDRVGIVIKKHGSWRDTVIHYAKYKNLVSQATSLYDHLIQEGWMECWAALRAVDEHCCADVIANSEAIQREQMERCN